MEHDDGYFMALALDEARAAPRTLPNPRVGAVLARDKRVLAKAGHAGPGSPHAEALVLAAAQSRDLDGATLYVTLEPCAHHGNTPPCAPAIAGSGVTRVVVGTLDPDERVAGRGVRTLEENGIIVATGCMAEESRRLNLAYLHHRTTGRAFLSLKLALSLDGRLAAPDGTSRWLTGPEARRVAHARRLEAGAVMVGAGTVRADDPALTVRDVAAPRQPLRLVVDSSGRTPSDARVFEGAGDPDEVVVATTDKVPLGTLSAWKEAGAEVIVLDQGSHGVDLRELLTVLGARGMAEVFCEGGARLASALIGEGLVDRLELHYGAVLTGPGGSDIGAIGVTGIDDAPRWRTIHVEPAGEDVLVTLIPAAGRDGQGA